jgi:hypothetical protein
MPGTPPGKDGPAPISEANSRASARQLDQTGRPGGGEIVAVVGPPDTDADWQKPISKYLRLGTIPEDKTDTRCLVRWAKGYLIHNDELYHRSTSSILHRCTP